MQRPRDLPAHRGIRLSPTRVAFIHWDGPDYAPSMTQADIDALTAHIRALVGEEVAREIEGARR